MSHHPESAWIITDGAAGNVRQADALAAALGMEACAFTLALPQPWRACAPRLLPGAWRALAGTTHPRIAPPWPDLAIGCGRTAALATRLLRTRSGGQTFGVQVLDPRLATRHWDVVVAPGHDGTRGDNVLTTIGSLNLVDDAWLADGRAVFPQFGQLPRPRVALLIGGPRAGIAFDAALCARLVAMVRACIRPGSVLATTSRRSPAAFVASLRDALGSQPGIWTGPGGMNPYAAILGWADVIIATPDSVNMLSEACATGVPVHAAVVAPLPPRLARFHAALREHGWLTDLGAPRTQVPPLRETPGVADAILARFAARPLG